MTSLTIIRGLPGSGKSTLAKAMKSANGAGHYEADMYFVHNGVYEYDGMKIGQAHEWCLYETKYCLMHGHPAIVSNTFTRLKELRPYFELAQELNLPCPQVIICQNSFGSVHGVPESVMENMRNRFAFDISPLMKEFGYIK